MAIEATSTRAAVGTRTRHGRLYWLRYVSRGFIYLVTLALGITFMLPFFWALSSAFKPPWELYIFPPLWFPKEWQPYNFVRIWQLVPFARSRATGSRAATFGSWCC
jgi:multiple sugar transport system permease protein